MPETHRPPFCLGAPVKHDVFLSHTGLMARVPAGVSFVDAAIAAVNEAARTFTDMRHFTADSHAPRRSGR